MALRIEIAMKYNGLLELRIGDLDGSSTMSNVTKKDILDQVSDDIDDLIEEWEKNDRNNN